MNRTLLAIMPMFGALISAAQTPNITIQMNIQHATCGNATGGINA